MFKKRSALHWQKGALTQKVLEISQLSTLSSKLSPLFVALFMPLRRHVHNAQLGGMFYAFCIPSGICIDITVMITRAPSARTPGPPAPPPPSFNPGFNLLVARCPRPVLGRSPVALVEPASGGFTAHGAATSHVT